MDPIKVVVFIAVAAVVVIFLSGIRIVRPTHRGLIERLGKYRQFAAPGFHWIIPLVDRMVQVNVTEQRVDAQPQEIITNDNLNARVDAQVYFKVKEDEASVKSSQYSVNNYQFQIVNLARTTLRNIIGTLTLKSANSERDRINTALLTTLSKETQNWGMQIVRTELKEIDPPKDVQETMNKVVKAENEKVAALDFANAVERQADGVKRSEIKKAEGIKQAKILAAEGEAEAIKLVNEAANTYFIGNAQLLKRATSKKGLVMRIAMLSWESLHSIAVGGVAAHVSELAAALARQGHQIHVFTRRAFGQAGHDWTDGVHYHRCTYPPHGDFVDDVNNMCRSFVDRVFEVEDLVGRFDIIHAHDWLTANAMIWIKQGRGCKCLFTIHSTEYARCGNAFPRGRSDRIRYQERAGTYWADRVIAVSQAAKDEITWMYEVPRGKTSVVYNGVSPQRFDQPTDPGVDKRRYHIGPSDPTILFCGRLTWQKGPDILVEAIPPILKRHPSSRFVFVGDGDMRDALESRVRQLGVAHAVRFLGYRNGDELVHLYKLAEVICVPSRNEPFGIVVLEAWSAGKPVIASQNGGPAEYVRHEVNGLKIYPNPDSVAWGVGRMFSDFARARWMGRNGRKAVEERFTWDTITEQMLAVYQGVCPSPAILPHRAANSVRAMPARSSRAASWAGTVAENAPVVKDRFAALAHLRVVG